MFGSVARSLTLVAWYVVSHIAIVKLLVCIVRSAKATNKFSKSEQNGLLSSPGLKSLRASRRLNSMTAL